jgi:hypothetical protein
VRSVADDLRARTVNRVLALSLPERMALALALGDDDLDLFVRVSGLDRDEARRRLCTQRHRGRAPSVANIGSGR